MGSQFDNLSGGVVDHMRRVYATLAAGIGISAGASIFAMATPLGDTPRLYRLFSVLARIHAYE